MIWNYKKRLNDDTIVKIIGTLDDTGAWLGDSPGHKFYPLYDAQGHRLGGKVNNDSTSGTE